MKPWFTPHPNSLLSKLNSPSHLRWESTANQLWIVALLIGPWFDERMHWQSWLAPTVLSMPVYLYLHHHIYAGDYRRLPWYAAGMALLGFVTWPFNGVAIGYIVAAAMCLAYLPTMRRWLGAMAILAVPTYAMSQHQQVPSWTMLLLAFVSLASGFGHYLRMNNYRRDAELRLSQNEVRRLATLAERERIGRDLHDLLGHTLSLVALKSELASRLAQRDPERAQREMDEVGRVVRHALAEVRTAVTGMRRGDLAAELVSARLMLEASGLNFSGVLPDAMALSPAIEAPLALVLREAVTNIHRHARARSASVSFAQERGQLLMRISDDGCGGLSAHGNGVSGMRERVRALGGSLQIESPPRRGTVLSVQVPLGARQEAEAAPTAPAAMTNDRSAA